MALLVENSYKLNGKTSNFVLLTGENNRTLAALARIVTRKSKGRNTPPGCGNGFETAKTAFARGHVIALELGGSDQVCNLVPQFEHWQGLATGPWRQMESEIERLHNGRIMYVEIGYSRTGGDITAQTIRDFEEDRLMAWTDARIPDRFEVWVVDCDVDPQTLSSPGLWSGAVAAVKAKTRILHKVFTLGNAMPEPDRGNYIIQHGVGLAQEMCKNYSESNVTNGDTQMEGPEPHSPTTYLLHRSSATTLRADMLHMPGITPPEAAGLQIDKVILKSISSTPSKLIKRRQLRESEGLAVVAASELQFAASQVSKSTSGKKHGKDESASSSASSSSSSTPSASSSHKKAKK